jgi:hypothetical protein
MPTTCCVVPLRAGVDGGEAAAREGPARVARGGVGGAEPAVQASREGARGVGAKIREKGGGRGGFAVAGGQLPPPARPAGARASHAVGRCTLNQVDP